MGNRFREALHGSVDISEENDPSVGGIFANNKYKNLSAVRPLFYEGIEPDDISILELSSFLKGKLNDSIFELRLNKVKAIIDAVICLSEADIKAVSIFDKRENIPYWIGAIKKGISDSLNEGLIFNVKDSKDNMIQNCIISYIPLYFDRSYGKEDKDVIFFNMEEGISTNFEYESKYSELVQVGFSMRDENFFKFKDFLMDFNYTNLDKEIDDCLILYNVLNNGLKGVSGEKLNRAMNFALNYSPYASLKKYLEGLKIDATLNGDILLLIIEAIFIASKECGDKPFKEKGFEILFDALYYRLANKSWSYEELWSFYKKASSYENSREEIVEYLLSDVTINKFLEHIGKCGDKLYFYLYIILTALEKEGISFRAKPLYNIFVSSYIDAMKNNNEEMDKVINNINAPYLKADLLVVYFEILKDMKLEENNALKLLMVLSGEAFTQLRAAIKEVNGGLKLIFAEYSVRLRMENSKKEYFWRYYKEYFQSDEEYKLKFLSDGINLYLMEIRNEDFYLEEGIKILSMILKDKLKIDEVILKEVIEDLEQELPVDRSKEGYKDAWVILERIKKERNVLTSSIDSLSKFGQDLKNKTTSEGARNILVGQLPNLKNVKVKLVGEFIGYIIDILLNKPEIEEKDMYKFYRRIKHEIKQDIPFEAIFKGNIKDVKDEKLTKIMIMVLLNYQMEKDPICDFGVYKGFVEEALSRLLTKEEEIKEIFNMALKEQDYLSSLLMICFNRGGKKVALEYMIKKSSAIGRNWANNLRHSISKQDAGGNFLFEEFKLLLKREESKVPFFWRYSMEVLGSILSYKSKYFNQVYECYLSSLEKEKNYISECLKVLVKLVEEEEGERALLARCIKVFEVTLPIKAVDETEQALINKLIKIKEVNKIVIKPDMLYALSFALQLKAAPKEAIVELLKGFRTTSLQDLSEVKYIELLNLCLNSAFSNFKSVIDMKLISDALYIKAYSNKFYVAAGNCLVNKLKGGSIKVNIDTLLSITKTFTESEDALMEVLIYSRNNLKNEDSEKLYLGILEGLSPEHAKKLQKRCFLHMGGELVYADYKNKLRRASDKLGFFQAYSSSTFKELKDYTKAYFSKALQLLLSIEPEYSFRYTSLVELIYENQEYIPKETLITIIEKAYKELAIDFNDIEQNRVLELACNMSKNKLIKVEPDIPGFLSLLKKVSETEDNEKKLELMKKESIELSSIDGSQYEECLEYSLPYIMELVDIKGGIDVIYNMFIKGGHIGIFFSVMINSTFVVLQDNTEGIKSFENALVFFLRCSSQDDSYYILKANLIAKLNTLNEGSQKEVDAFIREQLKEEIETINKWDEIWNKVAKIVKNERSLFSFVFRK